MRVTEVIHKAIRALVADDCRTAREVLNEGISVHKTKRYIEVERVDNGAAALEALRNKKIDIAFIDINMPGLSGPEVVAAIHGTKSQDCLVVAVSGNLDEKSETVLKRFDAYHFMKKPFTREEVADVVGTFIIMTTSFPILIVDDSATMRKLARKVLDKSRFDFDIAEAGDAQTALRALGSGKYKLALTDFHMPGTDGLELAGAIRDLSSKIGIFMMSTNDTTYLERSAAFIGISGFLKKPFDANDVDMLMHKYLELDAPKFGKVRDMFSFLQREQQTAKGAAA